jgi:hypothetical protein
MTDVRTRERPSAARRPAPVSALMALLLLAGSGGAARAAELVMFQQSGCAWCAVWLRDVGPIYPKSPEGRFAPLRQVDIRHPPAELTLEAPVTTTPTFVLVDDGREIGRITGYPGQSFFWELLSELLSRTKFRGETGAQSAPNQRASENSGTL